MPYIRRFNGFKGQYSGYRSRYPRKSTRSYRRPPYGNGIFRRGGSSALGGRRSYRRSNISYTRSSGRRTYARKGRGGIVREAAVQPVVVRSILRNNPSVVCPDRVERGQFSARITCLTDPSVPTRFAPDSNGKINWWGLTCDTTYEFDASGPFCHRRIIFKSPVPWPCGNISPAPVSAGVGAGPGNTQLSSSGFLPGEYVRECSTSIADPKLAGCLSRLFLQHTYRGVLKGPVHKQGLTVLRDETYTARGVEHGVRNQKKYWDSFKSEPTMEYSLEPDGSWDFLPQNAPTSQHLYLVDIYSFGLGTLDAPIPRPTKLSGGAQSGEIPSGTNLPSSKRMKSDSSSGSWEDGVADLHMTDSGSAFASITTTMKLYFKPAV